MAEPLKHAFGPDVPQRIAAMIAPVYSAFDHNAFLDAALAGYEDLELTPRARHIAQALARHLPADRKHAIEILVASLGSEIEAAELTGMASFLYLPHVFFVAEQGLGCYETAMHAQYELTKRFTAEFSIRAYLERYPTETLARLRQWASDPNVHVRRLVSEGTRPRLPWASRLRQFQADPTPVLALLEMLKDDPEEYVRRSVANNLNDISKDNPEQVVEVAARWWPDATHNRKRLIRHALRTLIKQGHPGALTVLGYAADSPASIRAATCTPEQIRIGEKVVLVVELENPSSTPTGVLVDLRVHFVKKNGTASPKVFKGGTFQMEPGGTAVVRKTISLAQHSTRTPYPGVHRVEVLLNGKTYPGSAFKVI